jgi:hypothetical protein
MQVTQKLREVFEPLFKTGKVTKRADGLAIETSRKVTEKARP